MGVYCWEFEVRMNQKHKKTHAAITDAESILIRYQDVIVGNRSLWATVYYELCLWLSPLPGAIGLLLRKLFWPRLFGTCGKGVQFGSNINLRHPKRIHLGNNVVISEGCILDARNPSHVQVIVLGENVILSNNVMISCKGGSVVVGSRTGIGAQTIMQSGVGEPVVIGDDVIIGPRCYVTGGGNYNTERLDIPIWQQGKRCMGGSKLEKDVWLGANVTILGGVTVGSGSIVAAGAVVIKDIAERTISAGVPAKVVKLRFG